MTSAHAPAHPSTRTTPAVDTPSYSSEPRSKPHAAARSASTAERAAHPPRSQRPWRTIALCWLCGLIITLGWDRALWLAVSSAGASKFQWLEAALSPAGLLDILNQRGSLAAACGLLYAGVYFFGRLWLWLVIAIVLVFRHWLSSDTHRVKRGLREGVFINLVPLSAGLAAEVLKLITRRVRPETLDGHWGFKPAQGSPIDPNFWSTSGLSMASSHASVAFGAALAAGALFPRLRLPLLIIAGICTLSRVVVGAHFLSDVYVGASLGVAAFVLLRAWDARNNAGIPIDSPREMDHAARMAQ